jgi:tetratricopeptide (TPR) repeat protein
MTDRPQELLDRAIRLQQSGQAREALDLYNRALPGQQDNPAVHFNIGLALQMLGRPEEALASYGKALAISPGLADAHYNRGTVLRELKRLDEALASYDQALAIRPDYAEVYSNRGNVLRELGRLDEALASYDQASAIKPDYAGAHYNRGIALRELKRPEEALASHDRALAIKPNLAAAWCNRGTVLQDLQRLDEAMGSYDRALAIQPDFADAEFSKAGLLLLTGRYPEGWPLYEARLRQDGAAYCAFPKPVWHGEDIRGKKLLVTAEQGFGDTIQFCRYLPLVHAMGAELIVEVPRSLAALVSTLKCPVTIVAQGATLPEFDTYCAMLSLPHIFKTRIETIPAEAPYLFSDAQKVGEWRGKLGGKERLRVGLAWSGSARHKRDLIRSIPLETLLPLTGQAEVEFHSLQKEYRQADGEILNRHPEIRQHQDTLGDFSDSAALVECMDLVISVDTSMAHLAGAMGKPVWVLLPFSPDFRWLLERKDSPWYPTARLYRQPGFDDWESVVAMARQDLVRLAGS